MSRLLETDALEGAGLPLALGGCTLRAGAGGPLWLVAPMPGQAAGAAAALGVAALPGPGESAGALLWAGLDEALWRGPLPEGSAAALAPHAALAEVSDAYAVLVLEGAAAPDVLARLVPVDLDAAAFPPGRVARTLLGQIAVLVVRDGAGFALFVPRSMAGTAVGLVGRAMRGVAARGLAPDGASVSAG